MTTTNFNLPLITENMANDVVRDMNALAEATDVAIKATEQAAGNQLATHSKQAPTKTTPGHIKLQEDFIKGALQNSWQGTFEYAKNDLGMVSLALVGYGTVVAGNTVIAYLPVGYRPKTAITMPTITDLKDGIKHLIITTGGAIEIPTDTPFVVNKVYLASLSFYAEDY